MKTFISPAQQTVGLQ